MLLHQGFRTVQFPNKRKSTPDGRWAPWSAVPKDELRDLADMDAAGKDTSMPHHPLPHQATRHQLSSLYSFMTAEFKEPMLLAQQRENLAEKYAGHCNTTQLPIISRLLPWEDAGVRWSATSQTLRLPRSQDFPSSRT